MVRRNTYQKEYYEKHKEGIKKLMHTYYIKNKKVLKEKIRTYYIKNSDIIKNQHKLYYKNNKYWINAKISHKSKIRLQRLKLIIISHYSPNLNCVCCGETKYKFLSIDHINNDGNLHRKKTGIGGDRLYNWIIKNNFPEGFQILCMNCNFGKRMNNGICPHKTSKVKLPITVTWCN